MNPIDTIGGSKPVTGVAGDRPSGGAKVGGGNAESTSGRSNRVLADDTVELTDTASRLGELSNELARADGVDLERVEAIRQRIAEGSYEVDADRVAEALVQLERDLG